MVSRWRGSLGCISIVVLRFGVAAAHYSLGDEVAIKPGVGCEFGVDERI